MLQRIKRNFRLILATNLARMGWCSKPSFLIIGAQKAGTAALFHYLSIYPDLTPAQSNEIRFFNRDRFYLRGEAWYHAHFPIPLGSRQIVAYESTPEYLYHPKCAKRIYAYNPDIKLLVLLRDPIERAFSAWNMYRHLVEEQPQKLYTRSRLANDDTRQAIDDLLSREKFPNFTEVVRQEMESLPPVESWPIPGYVARGLYAVQLRRFFEYFPREQIWIGESRRLRTDTPVILDQIIQFLGVPRHDWSKEPLPEHHVGKYKNKKIPEQTRTLLEDFYSTHNQELYELLGKDLGWEYTNRQ